MVDTEHVLEQMRAANPAPSLEQLAVDDLDLVRNIVARERSAPTTPTTEPAPARPDLLTPRRGLRPVLVAALAFVLVLGTLGGSLLLFRGADETATTGFTCPPGSTPDRPGPADQLRPESGGLGLTTFHPGSSRVLHLARNGFWTFDVCTNTWTTAPGPGEDIGVVTDFVYDVDSDRVIAFFTTGDDGIAPVASYEPATQTWTVKSEFLVSRPTKRGGMFPWLKAVYDPVTGLVVVLEPSTAAMWTYDVDADTWTEIDQGTTWPPHGGPFFTYDASVDRLIVYHPGDSTWEYDLRAGRWEEHTANTPAEEHQGFGWVSRGNEFVYDEANQVSVFFSHEHPSTTYVFTYDAFEHRWTGPQTRSDPGSHYPMPPMTYDPVNERIVMELFHDSYPTGAGVIAYDVATGEWITLLEPTGAPAEKPTATAALACPPGSTPDEPGPAGPRPPGYGPMTFDSDSGLALMPNAGSLWTFDVCTNTWSDTSLPEEGQLDLLVYDVDSELAVSFAAEMTAGGDGAVEVWAFEPATQRWTRKRNLVIGPPPEWFFPVFPQFQAVHDAGSGLVVVREVFTSQMWTYDVDTDTWTEIDQGAILPPAVGESGPHVELLTYDASVDRLILYVASDGAARYVLGTWEFDIRAGRWEEQETNTPSLSFGWWPTGEEFTYDETNQVSILLADERVAMYNASARDWTVIPRDGDTSGYATYDPVNERILVLGASASTGQDPIVAFDVATGEWITLIQPTAE